LVGSRQARDFSHDWSRLSFVPPVRDELRWHVRWRRRLRRLLLRRRRRRWHAQPRTAHPEARRRVPIPRPLPRAGRLPAVLSLILVAYS
jgi:hypothetical protein